MIRIDLLDGDLPEGVTFEYLPDSKEFVFSIIKAPCAASVRLSDLQARKLAAIIEMWRRA